MSKKEIKILFKRKGFVINDYYEKNGCLIIVVSKDYSEGFNIDFNGKIKLLVKIDKKFLKYKNNQIFKPVFYELSGLIPQNAKNHFYLDGSICYAPPERPLYEKWQLFDYIEAVDAMINDWFNKEYVGVSKLHGLEHGEKGKTQYSFLKSKL